MPPSTPQRAGILAPMRAELRPLLRRLPLERSDLDGVPVHAGRLGGVEVVATLAGVGMEPAAEATERLIRVGRVDHVVMVGIAGGIDPDLDIGDIVTPEAVVHGATGQEHRPTPLGGTTPSAKLYSSDEVILDPDVYDRLRDQGVVALDMETAAVAAVCEEAGIPWSVFRSVSDRSEDGLVDEAIGGLAKADGSANLAAVGRYVASHPLRSRKLAKLGRDMKVATNAAAEAAVRGLRSSIG